MLGLFAICYFLFPLSVLFPIKRIADKNAFLEKEDTDLIKGIATYFIILAHLIIPIKGELQGIGLDLKVYEVIGGMGVLLFFFVSGYGINKGYGSGKLTKNY